MAKAKNVNRWASKRDHGENRARLDRGGGNVPGIAIFKKARIGRFGEIQRHEYELSRAESKR